MRILVVGSGMYVAGRNNNGTATVLSSLAQISKTIFIDEVTIVAKNEKNEEEINKKIREINKKLNSNLKIKYISIYKIKLNDLCKKKKFDCAIVSTPDHLHYKHIKLLLKNKIHVLCVKPLVTTVNEHKKLISLQKKYNVLGIVEFHKRYDESNLYTKKLIFENVLGDIIYFNVDYSQKITIPTEIFKKWATKTNIFQYLGVHYVDLFYYMTKFKPIKAMAYGTKTTLKSKGIDTYDSIHASIIWKDSKNREVISIFNINWIDSVSSSAMSDQKYKIITSNGRIENDQKNRGIELVTDKLKIQHPNPYFSEYLLDIDGSYEFSGYGYKSISQFIIDINDIITKNKKIKYFKNRPTFEDTLITTYILEAVNNSLKNNSKWENICIN